MSVGVDTWDGTECDKIVCRMMNMMDGVTDAWQMATSRRRLNGYS